MTSSWLDYAYVTLDAHDLELYFEIRNRLDPDRFKRILLRAIRGRAHSLTNDFAAFVGNFLYYLVRDFGGQKCTCVRIFTTNPKDVKLDWRYEITYNRYPFLSIRDKDNNVFYMGPLFRFTKKLPKKVRTLPKKEARARIARRRARKGCRYSPVPEYLPGSARDPMTRKK